jgi:DNA-binding transcriptional LysR family regulator
MRINKVNLNLLIAFDVLITEQSVTRAGRKLCISQSAMSSALAQLREIFRDPLLIREGRGMRATVRAVELAPLISQILRQVEAVIAQ